MDDRKTRDFTQGPVWDPETSRWLVDVRYPNGSRRRRRFRRERDARRAWAAEQTKLENGTWNPRGPRVISFGDALKLYEDHARIQIPTFDSFVTPALKVWRAGIPLSTSLARVTPSLIDAVKLARATVVKRSSVDRNLQVLRRFFNWCIEQDLATENPVKRVKFFRADTKRLRYLTEEEFTVLLREARTITKSPFLAEAIELAVYTGLRRGNLLGLEWSWIDWTSHVVRVPVTKSGKPHAVPLNAKAEAALKRLLEARSESPFVFAHTKGPSSGAAVLDLKNGFHTALEKAGIEDFRWHDLRHTFASWLVMRGASIRAVSELLGHQSMQMTLRYAHLSPGYLKAEISLLDDIGAKSAPEAVENEGKKRATTSPTDIAPSKIRKFVRKFGAPSTTRTCDLLVRSQTLYPTELWARDRLSGRVSAARK